VRGQKMKKRPQRRPSLSKKDRWASLWGERKSLPFETRGRGREKRSLKRTARGGSKYMRKDLRLGVKGMNPTRKGGEVLEVEKKEEGELPSKGL